MFDAIKLDLDGRGGDKGFLLLCAEVNRAERDVRKGGGEGGGGRLVESDCCWLRCCGILTVTIILTDNLSEIDTRGGRDPQTYIQSNSRTDRQLDRAQ